MPDLQTLTLSEARRLVQCRRAYRVGDAYLATQGANYQWNHYLGVFERTTQPPRPATAGLRPRYPWWPRLPRVDWDATLSALAFGALLGWISGHRHHHN